MAAHASTLDPTFLSEHPELHFDLIRCQYMQLVAAGDTGAALQLARSQLAPLADRYPSLQPVLKVESFKRDFIYHMPFIYMPYFMSSSHLEVCITHTFVILVDCLIDLSWLPYATNTSHVVS
jgi:hypothetical protein